MKSLPKHVASTTLSHDQAQWSAGFIKGDIGHEVSQVKHQPGRDILIYGSADLVSTLPDRDLIDELRLWVTPVVVGSGKRLFPEGRERRPMALTDTTTFRSGAVVLAYRPGRHENTGSRQQVHSGEVTRKTCARLHDESTRSRTSKGRT